MTKIIRKFWSLFDCENAPFIMAAAFLVVNEYRDTGVFYLLSVVSILTGVAVKAICEAIRESNND